MTERLYDVDSALIAAVPLVSVQQADSAYGASRLPIDVEHRAVLAQVLEAPLEIAPLRTNVRPKRTPAHRPGPEP